MDEQKVVETLEQASERIHNEIKRTASRPRLLTTVRFGLLTVPTTRDGLRRLFQSTFDCSRLVHSSHPLSKRQRELLNLPLFFFSFQK